jgi:beta-carotene 3-hydroxylase
VQIEILGYLTIIFFVFVVMEGVAWFLHKYVMHGFGWYLHKDHHYPRKGRFEKNDIFAVFFSIISFLFILTAIATGFYFNLAVGIGIILYGIGYFLVHDVFFHKRIKIGYSPKSQYIKRILNAHGIHHAMSTPKTGINFGFLYASRKYEVKKNHVDSSFINSK